MNGTRPPQIRTEHLQRLAVVYVRQSTPKQVEMHTGSTAHQRNQKLYALQWGWGEAAILVIDEDLGLSGTSGEHRQGWQRLLKLISDGRVGIIFVSEISRLSRSRRDFFTLVDLCREFDVLLVVEGTIVQFDDPHDTFMANIKADVAEYDNAIRKATFMKAKWTKARQGHAVSACPTGYVVSQKGKWAKDPETPVRQSIEVVFKQFEVLGTLGKVLRFLIDHRLELPVRRGSELRWGPPTRHRIHQILTNPAFAGFYAFGRESSAANARMGESRRTGWNERVMIADHHEAYVSPAEWDRISERLRSNWVANRQPAGPGPALCQGLVRCGHCGRRMATHYYRHPRRVGSAYVCDQARQQFGQPPCWRVNGRRLDEVVVTELLRALAPPEVESVIAAASEVNAGYEAIRCQREAELKRVQYEAEIAERRFKQVDPANRLVAAGLERDLELALAKVRKVERQQAETPLAPPLEVTPESLDAIRRVAADLPRLWSAPSTTDHDRKLIVRLLVHKIQVTALSEADFQIEIGWIGGATTRHSVARPFAGVTIARQLAAQGLTEEEIAAELNRRGLRTVFKGGAYTALSLRRALEYHARKAGTAPPPWRVYREELRAPLAELVNAGWTDAAIVAEFNRRGLRSYGHRTPWTRNKIMWLRGIFGIQSVPVPRVRVRKASRIAAEALRAPLTELVQAGWSDGVIAVEFNQRDLPKWGYRDSWDKAKIYNLRRALGIQSVPSLRVRLRRSPPASKAEG